MRLIYLGLGMLVLSSCQQQSRQFTPVLNAGGGRFYSTTCLVEKTAAASAPCEVVTEAGRATAISGPIFLFHAFNFDSKALCGQYSKDGTCTGVLDDSVKASDACNPEVMNKDAIGSASTGGLSDCGQALSSAADLKRVPVDIGYVSRLVYRLNNQSYQVEMFQQTPREVKVVSYESGVGTAKAYSQASYDEMNLRATQIVNTPLAYPATVCPETGPIIQYRVNNGRKLFHAQKGGCITAQMAGEDATKLKALVDQIAGEVAP